tara:strand:+ start:719 stop:1699 length:981 start_codon:yes stop_codon:yes gene_type:complete
LIPLTQQGKKVEDFEKAVSQKCKVKYTAAVSSGSAALHLALLALKIGKKDSVAIPSYSCTALLNALQYVGATPKFIDIDPETLNISSEDLKKKMTRRVKAVIVPHMFGFPADILEIKKLGLPIIEDCALALGARYRGKPVGYWGDISVFSFYATKVIATGEGGMIATRSKSLANYIRDIREYDRYENYRVRYNYKMTDLAAALGLSQLAKLNVFLKKRKQIALYYDNFFSEKRVQSRELYPESKSIHYRYILKTDKSVKELIKKLKKNGVTAELPVFRPLHHIYKSSHLCRFTDKIWKSVYSIPIYPSLTSLERQQIVRVVKNYDS